METKICTKCKRELPYNMFCKCKTHKDGYDYYCKECKKEQYINNREKRLKYQKEYKEQDENRFKEQQKRYKDKNKEKIKERTKRYEEENKEKVLEYRKEYFAKNKDKILQYNRQYIKNRRKYDDLFYFKNKVRNLISLSFKRKSYNKNTPTKEILGCDFEFFKNHLYKTFFDNYGYEYNEQEVVHIDHIIPLKIAKTEEEVKRLCHYTNLQLLKADDNLKKSAKI